MYENLEKFRKWLKKVSKNKVSEIYLNETLKELDNQYCNTGFKEYELSKHETKSGNPEIYCYNVKESEDGGMIYKF